MAKEHLIQLAIGLPPNSKEVCAEITGCGQWFYNQRIAVLKSLWSSNAIKETAVDFGAVDLISQSVAAGEAIAVFWWAFVCWCWTWLWLIAPQIADVTGETGKQAASRLRMQVLGHQ